MSEARLRPRLILPAALVAALSVASTLPPVASSCPMEPPPPLRRLYVESELAVVARVGDATVASKDEKGSLYRVALHVSKLLKGDAEGRTLPLYQRTWGDEEQLPEWLEKGRTLLLFLNRRAGSDGYSLADYRLAAKQLSDEHLKVYVRRIEELASILARKDHDPAEVAEWLVRCAEEPATRWEGAYELALYAEMPSPDAEQGEKAGEAGDNAHAKDAAAADASGGEGAKAADKIAGREAAPSPDAAESITEQKIVALPLRARRNARPEPDFAALLTQSQKERLTAALVSAEELGMGEFALLPLVARWGDERFAQFILKHLQRTADRPHYEAAELMFLAARALGDKGLVKFAAEYAEGAAYGDLELPEEDEIGDDEESKKELAEMRAAAAEARNWRSTKVYHFLALAQQPQKP
jgi:hypothetical protein